MGNVHKSSFISLLTTRFVVKKSKNTFNIVSVSYTVSVYGLSASYSISVLIYLSVISMNSKFFSGSLNIK